MEISAAQPGPPPAGFRVPWPAGLLALGLAWGCAATGTNGAPPPKDAAQALYEQGLEDLDDGLYPEALKTFNEVKTRYPYTQYAPLADLRIADTHFERGKFVEAIDAYQAFLKLHPTHDQGPYAMLRIGDAHHDQIPEDWWFLPPSAEKDQGSTRQAIRAYQDMIARYPQHKMAAKARDGLKRCRTKLADHEMYVARFYFQREAFEAAAGRAEGLLGAYPGLGHDLEALWIAGRARLELGELDAARTTLQRLVETFPDTTEATEARTVLRRLETQAGEDKHG